LGGLKLGSGLARPENRNACFADGIGNPGRQWGLGTDDHQVDRQFAGQRSDGGGIVAVDGMRGDQLADACVAWRRVDFRNVGTLKEGADTGVFAAAGAYDEYLHSL